MQNIKRIYSKKNTCCSKKREFLSKQDLFDCVYVPFGIGNRHNVLREKGEKGEKGEEREGGEGGEERKREEKG